jgi:hypothetical protein
MNDLNQWKETVVHKYVCNNLLCFALKRMILSFLVDFSEFFSIIRRRDLSTTNLFGMQASRQQF